MKHIRLTSLYVGGDVVSYQSALIPTRTTMAKQQVKKIKRLLPVRVRKGELSQSKFTCPFLKKNGKQCAVLQPYRHLTEHCRKMHNQEVSLKCEIDDCSWECHISLRCLTSHRSNIETHGALIFNGGPNIDGSCKVVPYVEEEGGAPECHTNTCCVSTRDLTRFRAKMLKREERAAAAEKEKVVKPVVTGMGPVVAGIGPAPQSEKESFSNFGVQFKQLMAKGNKGFDDWESLNKILKANNMQVSAESLR
jgi:hypothetical protein